MKKTVLLSWALVLIFSSCSFNPPCISEKLEGMQISWGEYNKITHITRGYMLQSDGNLYFYEKETGHEKITLEKIKSLDDDNYCQLLSNTQKDLLKSQVLYTPGVISRFVEYNAPITNTFLRGMWNPLFKQNGSEKFVDIYNKLMTIVPNEEVHKDHLNREVSKKEFEQEDETDDN